MDLRGWEKINSLLKKLCLRASRHSSEPKMRQSGISCYTLLHYTPRMPCEHTCPILTCDQTNQCALGTQLFFFFLLAQIGFFKPKQLLYPVTFSLVKIPSTDLHKVLHPVLSFPVQDAGMKQVQRYHPDDYRTAAQAVQRVAGGAGQFHLYRGRL